MIDPTQASHPPAHIPGGIPAAARGRDLEFYRIADVCLAETFRSWPTMATIAGYHAFDDRLEDLTPDGIGAMLDVARRHRDRLAAVDPALLSTSARIDLELARNDLDTTLFTLEELRPFENDPRWYVEMLGVALLYLVLLDAGSPRWPEHLEALRGRLEGIPGFLEAARRNLKAPPRIVTELVVGLNAGNLNFVRDALPALFPRAPALQSGLERAAARAVAALQSFQDWLTSELLPASTGDWRLGRERWRRKLHYTLQSDMTPEDIVRRAGDTIDAYRHRLLDIAEPLHARLHPGHRHDGNAAERTQIVVREVLDEVSRVHPTRATLFDEVRRAIVRAKGFIRRRGLVTLPPDEDRLVLETTPGFMDGVAVAFFNPPPILEPDHRKSYWISTVPRGATPEENRAVEESFLREYNSYALQGLTIHEAFPGHYVQYWHALRSPIATVYKKFYASGTFAEGWAVLAEDMMFEEGYAENEPENLLVHFKHALRAPINAILDARLHTESIPEPEADRFALDLMTRVGFQEEAEARGKLRRAKVSSTQLSTYFVGHVELRDIVLAERRRLGPAFDLGVFNDRLLSFGTIPPRCIRQLLLEPSGDDGRPGGRDASGCAP